MPSLNDMDLGAPIPIAFSSDDLFEELLLPAPSLDMEGALLNFADAFAGLGPELQPQSGPVAPADSQLANTLNILLPSIVTPAPGHALAEPAANNHTALTHPRATKTRYSAESATLMSEDESDFDEEEGSGNTATKGGSTTTSGGAPKRRRRVRNAKQQELNRLAQQRYRLRKKQKQADLQLTVEQLACQLEQLKAKDIQIESLRNSEAVLKEQLRAQQAQLAQAQQELAQQRALVAQQAKELEALKATSTPATPTLEGLKDELIKSLVEMLTELGISGAQLEDMSQTLIRHMGCVYNNQLGLHVQPAANPITVSCC